MKLNFFKMTLALPRCLLLLAVMVTLTADVFTQINPTTSPTPQASPTPSLEKQFFKNILRDQKAIWMSPFHLNKETGRWLAPLGLSAAALIATDRQTVKAFDNASPNTLKASRNVSRVGSGSGTGSIAAAFYFVGLATGNRRARETGLLSAEALIDSAIVSQTLKITTQRLRPGGDEERGRFFIGGNSFPSGHAAGIWSIATVIAYEYQDKPLVKYGVYGLATAVSISRFTGQNHFPSDVLIGSAIGFGIGRFVYRKHHVEMTKLDDNGSLPPQTSKLMPMIIPLYERRSGIYGGTLTWNF